MAFLKDYWPVLEQELNKCVHEFLAAPNPCFPGTVANIALCTSDFCSIVGR
jgi:hypothetical protein